MRRIGMVVLMAAAFWAACSSDPVEPGPGFINVVPGDSVLWVADTLTLAVTDDAGQPVAGPVTWGSSATGIVTVSGA